MSQQELCDKQQKVVSLEEHEALKAELADFVYIISHDLNAPLRHTREFGKLLIKKLDDRITDDEREYADFMIAGVHSMEAMVEALLKFSRITTKAGDFETVDLNDIVESVINNLSESLNESAGKISYDLLPTIHADPKQIKELFLQLVDNGIKFRKEQLAPEIQIHSSVSEQYLTLTISDNGIGVDQKYHQQIFKIFKRLSVNKGLSGVGIGLNVAKKIVSRHHGVLSIDSEEGKGTTMTITFPISILSAQL